MKFTKRAYAKVWQNRPIDDREDTTITLLDHEDANEPNSIPVALLYLLECHASVNSMDESNILECCLTAEPSNPIGFVKTYRDMPSKTGDSRNPMKSTTASPNPWDATPPVSHCPRCGALTGPDTTQRRINGQPENDAEHYRRIPEIHKNNPDPLSCHNYRQRFKHVDQDQPAYKHQSNRADTLRTLKLKTETQPTSDMAEPTQ